MLWIVLAFFAPLLILGSAWFIGLYVQGSNIEKRRSLLSSLGRPESDTVVGFFHPYCNAGGGGERVLWVAIAYLQRNVPNVVSVVYTGDTDATKEEIIAKANARFGISIAPESIAFKYLPSRYLVAGDTWSRFTLLGQALGSMYLVWEAIDGLTPDIFIDTMGYAFAFTLIRLLNLTSSKISPSSNLPSASLPIGAYIHYPTISTDMLRRVRNREAGVTNNASVAQSSWKSSAKLAYYKIFARAYSFALSQANRIVVNGTFTKNHIDSLLASRRSKQSDHSPGVQIVYPPCDTEALQKIPLGNRKRIILSVAQFRPEKDHPAQLRAFYSLLTSHPEYRKSTSEKAVKLVLLGSVRNSEDRARVKKLEEFSKQLGIGDNVEFVLNAPYDQLTNWLARSSIGISSMVDEHFGINVVEFMAAGLIPVVHASGGPLFDIVTPISAESSADPQPTGFFYEQDPDSALFARSLHEALTLPPLEEKAMRERARKGAQRFSVEEFEKGFAQFWATLSGPDAV